MLLFNVCIKKCLTLIGNSNDIKLPIHKHFFGEMIEISLDNLSKVIT